MYLVACDLERIIDRTEAEGSAKRMFFFYHVRLNFQWILRCITTPLYLLGEVVSDLKLTNNISHISHSYTCLTHRFSSNNERSMRMRELMFSSDYENSSGGAARAQGEINLVAFR